MATLLQELYTAPEKFTRIQAMLCSMDLALDESLLAILRERAEKTDDRLERAVARYAIAYTTMLPDDIDAFLDAYLYDGRTVEGMFESGDRLRRGGGTLDLRHFLYQLATMPRHRHKALIALVADNSYHYDYMVVSGYEDFGLGPLPEDVILQGEALHDDSHYYYRQIEEFDARPVIDRFLALLGSPEKESRVAVYLIAYKLVDLSPESDFLCERFAARLSSGMLSTEEADMLRFSMRDPHFCGTRNLAGESQQKGEISIIDAFYDNLPDTGPAMCRLLALEDFTRVRSEQPLRPDARSREKIVDIIIGSAPSLSFLSARRQKELEALLECDPELVGPDRIARVRRVLGK
jgi:hypothetical protein